MGQRIMRGHVEEFAYLVAKLKSIPEGDGTLLDHTCLVFVHEHAEANIHKNSGVIAIVAARRIASRTAGIRASWAPSAIFTARWRTGLGAEAFPTSSRRLTELLA